MTSPLPKVYCWHVCAHVYYDGIIIEVISDNVESLLHGPAVSAKVIVSSRVDARCLTLDGGAV